eukprot:TRINITY_DN2104_c0_g1_i3.p1 TRINITY_DN2104_c0_g1~~TRINITY_DN2104_c0_g1_i3.p1  ORF type:complete len:204 (-),score=41.12 TRINITY_DN2104_c0_g1_i3:138-749(-)
MATLHTECTTAQCQVKAQTEKVEHLQEDLHRTRRDRDVVLEELSQTRQRLKESDESCHQLSAQEISFRAAQQQLELRISHLEFNLATVRKETEAEAERTASVMEASRKAWATEQESLRREAQRLRVQWEAAKKDTQMIKVRSQEKIDHLKRHLKTALGEVARARTDHEAFEKSLAVENLQFLEKLEQHRTELQGLTFGPRASC